MKLEDIDKNSNPFKVPDGYFNGLSSDIMNKIHEKPMIRLSTHIIRAISIAAIILISVFTISPRDTTMNNIDEEIVNYFYSTSDLEEYIVSEMYTY